METVLDLVKEAIGDRLDNEDFSEEIKEACIDKLDETDLTDIIHEYTRELFDEYVSQTRLADSQEKIGELEKQVAFLLNEIEKLHTLVTYNRAQTETLKRNITRTWNEWWNGK